jgi:hypothetical protein
MDIDNQDKTPTIADNLNPVWNHETYFKVYEGDDTIQFNVSTTTCQVNPYFMLNFQDSLFVPEPDFCRIPGNSFCVRTRRFESYGFSLILSHQ